MRQSKKLFWSWKKLWPLALGLLSLYVAFQDWKTAKGKEGIMLPDKRKALLPYVFAQAYHETGGFKSRLAKEQNNLFGMNSPRVRPFVGQKAADGGFMTYKNWQQSVDDLMLWMDFTNFPERVRDSRQYALELKRRGYYEDTTANYLAGLNNALTKYPQLSDAKIG